MWLQLSLLIELSELPHDVEHVLWFLLRQDGEVEAANGVAVLAQAVHVHLLGLPPGFESLPGAEVLASNHAAQAYVDETSHWLEKSPGAGEVCAGKAVQDDVHTYRSVPEYGPFGSIFLTAVTKSSWW